MTGNRWQNRMEAANRVSQAYGLRSRVYGVRGTSGWYYMACFAPVDRQQIKGK